MPPLGLVRRVIIDDNGRDHLRDDNGDTGRECGPGEYVDHAAYVALPVVIYYTNQVDRGTVLIDLLRRESTT